MHCETCGVADCPRLKLWPDGSGCRTYAAARAGLPATIPAVAPDPAPASPAIRTRPLAEALELRLLIQECPHLVPKQPGDGCGCIGRCKAGKGDMHDGRSSYRNCESCQAKETESPGE